MMCLVIQSEWRSNEVGAQRQTSVPGARCQVDQLAQFILPGERIVVPGYYVGQAALLGGTGVQALVLDGSCGAVYIAR